MTTRTNADDAVNLGAGLRCDADGNDGVDLIYNRINYRTVHLDAEQLARLLIWLRGRCGACGGSGYVASEVQAGELAICGDCAGGRSPQSS